jgi:hypothetical protein
LDCNFRTGGMKELLFKHDVAIVVAAIIEYLGFENSP